MSPASVDSELSCCDVCGFVEVLDPDMKAVADEPDGFKAGVAELKAELPSEELETPTSVLVPENVWLSSELEEARADFSVEVLEGPERVPRAEPVVEGKRLVDSMVMELVNRLSEAGLGGTDKASLSALEKVLEEGGDITAPVLGDFDPIVRLLGLDIRVF